MDTQQPQDTPQPGTEPGSITVRIEGDASELERTFEDAGVGLAWPARMEYLMAVLGSLGQGGAGIDRRHRMVTLNGPAVVALADHVEELETGRCSARLEVERLERELAAARAQVGTQSGVIAAYREQVEGLRERVARAEAPPY